MREASETLSEEIVENWRYVFVHKCVDLRATFCTLTLTFLCLLGCRLCSILTKWNLLVYQFLPVSSKEVNCFPLRMRLSLTCLDCYGCS